MVRLHSPIPAVVAILMAAGTLRAQQPPYKSGSPVRTRPAWWPAPKSSRS